MRLFTESYTYCLTTGVPWTAEHMRTTVRRQEWAYYKLGRTTYGRITNSDVQHILGVSKPTASRILQQMNGWLEMQDVTGKSTYYMIKGLPNAS